MHPFKPLEKQLEALVWPSHCALSAWPAGAPHDDEFVAELSDEQQERFRQITDESRRAHWIAARKAELDVAREMLNRGMGEFVTSTSHSAGWAIAMAVSRRDGLLGVGVDLEEASRPVPEELSTRLVSADEERFGLELLEHWAIKEACFKSDPENAGRVTWQYRLVSEEEATSKAGVCRYKLCRQSGFLVAFAVCCDLRISK